ncbi:hypothetical protein BCR34DRAFT_96562 [Clohesyomyces aquaticus]|uniref:Uncharacterized protein n=1 Tax=Clohesyomyces aquaticus TaxID=1231657 RepID=A0A1Y2A262_9PLEO|nr:hypothetical protein BCR34DRAFT_96562 [Clohesyomyces aquaticus]
MLVISSSVYTSDVQKSAVQVPWMYLKNARVRMLRVLTADQRGLCPTISGASDSLDVGPRTRHQFLVPCGKEPHMQQASNTVASELPSIGAKKRFECNHAGIVHSLPSSNPGFRLGLPPTPQQVSRTWSRRRRPRSLVFGLFADRFPTSLHRRTADLATFQRIPTFLGCNSSDTSGLVGSAMRGAASSLFVVPGLSSFCELVNCGEGAFFPSPAHTYNMPWIPLLQSVLACWSCVPVSCSPFL